MNIQVDPDVSAAIDAAVRSVAYQRTGWWLAAEEQRRSGHAALARFRRRLRAPIAAIAGSVTIVPSDPDDLDDGWTVGLCLASGELRVFETGQSPCEAVTAAEDVCEAYDVPLALPPSWWAHFYPELVDGRS